MKKMWTIVLFLIATLFIVNDGKVAVLILARGGSKGVRLKNIQNVGEISLLTRAIHTAKVAGLNDITVSTENPIIALQAIVDNATVFRRSPITATDYAPSIWGVAEFLEHRPDISTLILMQVTSPFIRPIHLRDALQKINYPVPYDCIFSATRSFKLRWSIVNGQLYPANFKINDRVRRQDWNGEFLETGAFYITRRKLLQEEKFQNHNCTVLEVSALESLEVDTEEDLQLANILLSANLV